MPPFFSVVIPVHGRLHLLARSVRSALEQTFRDFEIVVVNDGSTNGNLGDFIDFDNPRIRTVSQQQSGPGSARNRGIETSSGKWVAFLDADDIWKSSHLEELLKLKHLFPCSRMLATSIIEAREGEWSGIWPQSRYSSPCTIDYFQVASTTKAAVTSSSVAIERKLIEEVGKFSAAPFGEDLEYWARTAVRTPVGKSWTETVVYMRGNNGEMEKRANSHRFDAPNSLNDLSPSIAFLSNYLENARNSGPLPQERSIRRYINAGVDSTVLSAIRSGHAADVRSIRNLYLGPLIEHPSWERLLSSVPTIGLVFFHHFLKLILFFAKPLKRKLSWR